MAAWTLHLTWDGSSPVLWAEDGRRLPPVPGAGRAVRAHPFAVGAAALRRAAGVGSAGGARETELTLWLPSRTGAPAPCPPAGARPGGGGRLRGPGAPSRIQDPADRPLPLRRWRVPALGLDDAEARAWLLGRPEASLGLRLGPGATFWRQAARLALSLVRRRAFVPDLWLPEPGGPGFASWRPLLRVGRDRRALGALAAAMPPVDRWLHADSPAEVVAESFLVYCVDRFVRHALARERAALLAASGGRSAAHRWLRALLAAEPEPVSGADRLVRPVHAWTEPVRAPAPAAVRLCLRLEEPGTGEAEGLAAPDALPAEGGPGGARGAVSLSTQPPSVAEAAAAYDAAVPTAGPEPAASAAPSARDAPAAMQAPPAAGEGVAAAAPPWRIRFLLQSLEDPSLMVPAATIWSGDESLRALAGRGLAAPRAALLAGLGRASLAFPPLARALEAAEPAHVGISAEEAYDFLTRAAADLDALGVGVQVPAWWDEGRPGLQASVELTSRSSTGLFSPDSLVGFSWQLSLGGEPLSEEEFEALVSLKQPLVRHRGRWVAVGPEQAKAALRLLERGGDGGLPLGEAVRFALDPSEAGALDVRVHASGAFARVLEQLAGDARPEPFAEPPGFAGELRPYQRRGAGWLAFLSELGLGGCLADDMGLGKTVQLLAFLLHRRARRPDAGPVLLVCPTSVVGNWAREAARFAPGLRVGIHHGSERRRGDKFARWAAAADLVVTTYGVLLRDGADLGAVEWDGVALDEAQNVKNPSSKQSQAARGLRSRWRAALTGTPVENRLDDLWALFAFLDPGYLGSLESFRRTFALPAEREGDAAARERLRRIVQPFLLRRAKADPGIVDELPPKIETRVYCPLTPEQATLYEAVVREMIQRIDEARGVIERRGQVLAALTRLKQVCNHPAHYTGDPGPLGGRSGKLARLEELLEELLSAGDRALVFTQFAAFGQRLRDHLEERFGRPVLFLHGGVPREARTEMVRRFEQDGDAPVFVLSLRAGGTGLNLTAAQHVFHFDRWWNPAVEDQATDRAYRIGQRRSVQVHKFVCTGTLEERIDDLLTGKRELAAGVVGSGEGWLTELDTAELRRLFALRRDDETEA